RLSSAAPPRPAKRNPWTTSLLPCATLIEITVRARHADEVEVVDVDGAKRRPGDELVHGPVQATTSSNPHLEPVEAPLPALHSRLRAEAVFQKDEAPARSKHSVDFAQCLFDRRNAAQRERAHHAIKRRVGEGQRFARKDVLVHDYPGC